MRGLNLTPDLLEGAYEDLRRSPPFREWRGPDGDHGGCRVLGARDRFGHFRGWHRRGDGCDRFSEIAISARKVKTTQMLIATMAHEMIHLYQDENGTARGHHNPEFHRLAARVCAMHGFDPPTF